MTNIFTFPEEFDNAAWAKTGTVVTANAIAAPNSENTADLLAGNGGGAGAAYIEQLGISPEDTSTHYLSVFAKANGVSWMTIRTPSWSGGNPTYFDLANGAVGTVGGHASAGVVDHGNGWKRCWVTITGISTSTAVRFYLASANGSLTDRGASNSIYLWGAEFINADSLPDYFVPAGGAPLLLLDE